jgi:hypothetical protein
LWEGILRASQRIRDEIAEGLLRLPEIVLVHVDHQRRDRPVPTVRENLREPEARALADFRGRRRARMPERMTPDV